MTVLKQLKESDTCMKKSNSLFYKVYASTLVILLFISLFIFAVILELYPMAYINSIERRTQAIAEQLITQSQKVSSIDEMKSIMDDHEQHHNISAYVETSDGQMVANSSNLNLADINNYVLQASEDNIVSLDNNINSYQYIVYPNLITINDVDYKLFTFSEIPKKTDIIQPFVIMYPMLAVIIFIQTFIIAYFISRITIRPIETITKKAHAITNLDFDNDYSWNSNDEFGILSNDLDEMQYKMKQVINYLEDDSYLQNQLMLEEQKERISILSHELNTPLTILKMQSELLLQVESDSKKQMYLERNIRKVDEITKLVDQVLNYKVLEDSSSIDVAAFLSEIIETNYENAIISLEVRDILVVDMSELYLSRLLTNLISNAIKYNYGNEPIKIVISHNTIKVQNKHHPQLDFDKERLLKPYVRANTVNEIRGQGLGLYICKRICTLNDFIFDVSSNDLVFTALIKFESASVSQPTIEL